MDGQPLEVASAGDRVEVLLPETAFYVESGGQVSDTGIIRSASKSDAEQPEWEIEVDELRKPSAGAIIHVGEVIFGHPKTGDSAIAIVDMKRRHDIMRNHTATHLLHAALHKVLGETARQAGSLVAPDRLRFDFTYPQAMSPEQVQRVEQLVNDAVAADLRVVSKSKGREEAIAEGATALFGEKYGETVRTITIIPDSNSTEDEMQSYELCGGTHLERTSDVGTFLILSEGSTAAGIRRIEAVTGRGAYQLISQRFAILRKVAGTLKSAVDEVPGRAEALQEELSGAKKQIAILKAESAIAIFNNRLSSPEVVNGIRLLVIDIPNTDKDTLAKLADIFRDKYPEQGICVIGTANEDQVFVVTAVTQDLVIKGIKAGELVGFISRQLGAGGGGAPHLAFGGGKDIAKLPEALASVRNWMDGKIT
jgi:alanyl-tRNA synthetase